MSQNTPEPTLIYDSYADTVLATLDALSAGHTGRPVAVNVGLPGHLTQETFLERLTRKLADTAYAAVKVEAVKVAGPLRVLSIDFSREG